MAAGYVYSHVHHACYVHVLVLLMPVRMSVFRMIWSFPRPSYVGSALLQVRVCSTTYTRTRDERITWHIHLFISIKAAVFFSSTLCWMSRSPFHCWWIRKPLRDLDLEEYIILSYLSGLRVVLWVSILRYSLFPNPLSWFWKHTIA